MITIDLGIVVDWGMKIIGFLFGIYMFWIGMSWKKKAERYEGLAAEYEPKVRQLMSILGKFSGDKRFEARQEKLGQEAQQIIVQDIRKKIPLGLADRLKDEHIFALMFNPDFVKGGFRLFKGVGWGLSKFGIQLPGMETETPMIPGRPAAPSGRSRDMKPLKK